MELSGDQKIAYDKIVEWLESGDTATLSLGGYAGCGKSFLISHLIKEYLNKNNYTNLTMAYTGKAVSVLRKKGIVANTIHSTIYDTVSKEKLPDFIKDHMADGLTEAEAYGLIRGGTDPKDGVFWMRKRFYELSSTGIFIIDESSMVPKQIFTDLLSFGVPVLFVGDHGQLPPVDLGNSDFNTMLNPDLKLEKVHRQALDSSIIRLATDIRIKGESGRLSTAMINWKLYEPDISFKSFSNLEFSSLDLKKYDVIITGTNRTRILFNKMKRLQLKFLSEIPTVGDYVICLENVKKFNLFNGQIFKVLKVYQKKNQYYNITILNEDDVNPIPKEVTVDISKFNSSDAEREGYNKGDSVKPILFDYAYALTAHKCQGSEFENIMIAYESDVAKKWVEPHRWLYTAVTRAKKTVDLLLL